MSLVRVGTIIPLRLCSSLPSIDVIVGCPVALPDALLVRGALMSGFAVLSRPASM